MADNTDTTTTETPQAGASSSSPQPQAGATTSTSPQAGDGEIISLEEAKKLRSEAANLRKRLKAIEDEKEAARIAAEEATLSEVQKATKAQQAAEQRAQEYEAQVKQLRAQLVASETKLIAQSLGFHNPDIAAKVILDTLEYGEDGRPTNLDSALKELAKQNPFMVKSAEPAPTPAQTATPARVAPVTSPNNPGMSNTARPGSFPPGKVPTLQDVFQRP